MGEISQEEGCEAFTSSSLSAPQRTAKRHVPTGIAVEDALFVTLLVTVYATKFSF
jgi:hypothetical protein